MNTRMTLSLGLSALMLGGTMVGCTATGGQGIASASDRNARVADKQAQIDAARAGVALAQADTAAAILHAEAAVRLAPRDAGYRMILAQSYLRAGRFVSARQAYADVLELAPDDRAIVGKAALNLALAETATGDWAAARRTLDTHAHDIPVGDFGLALALAGDPNAAVTILTQAARTPAADAKLRQNLALSFALAGNWDAARVTAAADMSPADIDARLAQWAQFAQPERASDQVATLLRVTPVADTGQPVALALNATVPVAVAVAPSPLVTAVPAPMPAVSTPAVVFAAPHAVVQPLPVRLIRADVGATKVAVARIAAPMAVASAPAPIATATSGRNKGDWYVQFGAYENAAVARDGWARIVRRHAVLGDVSPTGMAFTSKAGSFYRLSAGGFTRADADRMCRTVRARGDACFVRKDAGDTLAKWLSPSATQVAAR